MQSVTKFLTSHLQELVRTAVRRNMAPPFDLHLTGSKGDHFQYQIDEKGPLLAREVAELHREKMELLEENASLKKGLEFLLGRYFSLATVARAPSLARSMSNEGGSSWAFISVRQ